MTCPISRNNDRWRRNKYKYDTMKIVNKYAPTNTTYNTAEKKTETKWQTLRIKRKNSWTKNFIVHTNHKHMEMHRTTYKSKITKWKENNTWQTRGKYITNQKTSKKTEENKNYTMVINTTNIHFKQEEVPLIHKRLKCNIH